MVSDALQGIENAVCAAFPQASHQFCVAHVKRQILNCVSHKDKPQMAEELNEVFTLENKEMKSLLGYEQFITFAAKWEKKYPVLKKYKAERNIAYFTYMDFPLQVQRCIYTTNWIERLHRKYKRTIKMRTSMPTSKSVLFLLTCKCCNARNKNNICKKNLSMEILEKQQRNINNKRRKEI